MSRVWVSAFVRRLKDPHSAVRLTSGIVLYGFSIAYLIAPGTFDSQHVVEFVSGLPEGVKYAGKAILAAPFAFHSWNGLRHLSWDMVKCVLLLCSFLLAANSWDSSHHCEGCICFRICCSWGNCGYNRLPHFLQVNQTMYLLRSLETPFKLCSTSTVHCTCESGLSWFSREIILQRSGSTQTIADTQELSTSNIKLLSNRTHWLRTANTSS